MRAHLLLVHCNLLSKNITSLSSRRHASVAKISGEVKAGGAGIVACVRVGLQLSWKLNSNPPGKKLTKHIKYIKIQSPEFATNCGQ